MAVHDCGSRLILGARALVADRSNPAYPRRPVNMKRMARDDRPKPDHDLVSLVSSGSVVKLHTDTPSPSTPDKSAPDRNARAGARFEIPPSMGAEPLRDARLRKTLEQLRDAREQSAQRHAVARERRRVEDQIRDERHDARAKTIVAGTVAERRRYRSDKNCGCSEKRWSGNGMRVSVDRSANKATENTQNRGSPDIRLR